MPRVDLTEAGEFTEAVAEMILFSAILLLVLFLSDDIICNKVGVTGGVEHGRSGKVEVVGVGTGVVDDDDAPAATGGVAMVGEGMEISSSIL